VGNLWKTIKPPLGRVPVYDQVYTLDIAETLHFFEDDRVVRVTTDPQVLRLGRRMNHGNALHLGGLLCVRRKWPSCRTTNETDELASPHIRPRAEEKTS
jgi:hypothetical protein